MNPLLMPLIELTGGIISRIWPDASAADKARLELLQAELSGELQLRLSQMTVNQTEAANPNWFVAGWRPAIGWICALSFAATYIGQPAAIWICFMIDPAIHPPQLPTDQVLTELLFGMLGIGGLRTFEKLKGVAR